MFLNDSTYKLKAWSSPVLDMPTRSHLHHRFYLCYLFPLPVWEKFSSLIPGPILCCQGPSPSGPFFHDVIVVVRDCEPISGPQSGSLINHYILGSTEPSGMLHVTVLFCSLTGTHCFREHRRAVSKLRSPVHLTHWVTQHPQHAWPKGQLPRTVKAEF